MSKELSNLLDRTQFHNKEIEQNFISLALCLVEVEESNAYETLGYKDFASYYRDELGRDKTTVSKLLTAGKWLKEHGCIDATVSYTKLNAAIHAYPDKKPQFILEAAKTNTLSELQEERKEKKYGVHEHEWISVCRVCGSKQ